MWKASLPQAHKIPATKSDAGSRVGSRQEGALWLGFTDLRCICLHFCYLRNGPKWCADPNRPGRRGDREGALVNPARRLGKVSPIHCAPASSEPDVDGWVGDQGGQLGGPLGPRGPHRQDACEAQGPCLQHSYPSAAFCFFNFVFVEEIGF